MTKSKKKYTKKNNYTKENTNKKSTNKRTKFNKNKKIIIEEGKFKGYENTFIISVMKNNIEYNINFLRKYLFKAGKNIHIQEDYTSKGQPIILHMTLINNRFNHQFYNTKCYLLNLLSNDKEVISNKYNLYYNFKKAFPTKCDQYMAKTYDFHKFNKNKILKDNEIFIFRIANIGIYGGKDVFILNDNKSIKRAEELAKKYDKCIVSEYIMNPMLFDGKKFHIRSYFMASNIEGVYRTYFLDFYQIITAEKPYETGKWNDSEIHDSHWKSTNKSIIGPYDIPKENKKVFEKAENQMRDCLKYISKILKNHCKPFENSKNAYEVFGCDFMIKDDGDIVLIEINDKIGIVHYKFPHRLNFFSHTYFSNLNKYVINPLFTNKYPDNYIYKSKL